MPDRRRVALVLFAEVAAVDDRDAAHLAEIALRQYLAQDVIPAVMPVEIEARFGTRTVPVTIAGITDLVAAVQNGYLTMAPTAKAFREVFDG